MARASIDKLGTLQKAVMEAVWELSEATVQQSARPSAGASHYLRTRRCYRSCKSWKKPAG